MKFDFKLFADLQSLDKTSTAKLKKIIKNLVQQPERVREYIALFNAKETQLRHLGKYLLQTYKEISSGKKIRVNEDELKMIELMVWCHTPVNCTGGIFNKANSRYYSETELFPVINQYINSDGRHNFLYQADKETNPIKTAAFLAKINSDNVFFKQYCKEVELILLTAYNHYEMNLFFKNEAIKLKTMLSILKDYEFGLTLHNCSISLFYLPYRFINEIIEDYGIKNFVNSLMSEKEDYKSFVNKYRYVKEITPYLNSKSKEDIFNEIMTLENKNNINISILMLHIPDFVQPDSKYNLLNHLPVIEILDSFNKITHGKDNNEYSSARDFVADECVIELSKFFMVECLNNGIQIPGKYCNIKQTRLNGFAPEDNKQIYVLNALKNIIDNNSQINKTLLVVDLFNHCILGAPGKTSETFNQSGVVVRQVDKFSTVELKKLGLFNLWSEIKTQKETVNPIISLCSHELVVTDVLNNLLQIVKTDTTIQLDKETHEKLQKIISESHVKLNSSNLANKTKFKELFLNLLPELESRGYYQGGPNLSNYVKLNNNSEKIQYLIKTVMNNSGIIPLELNGELHHQEINEDKELTLVKQLILTKEKKVLEILVKNYDVKQHEKEIEQLDIERSI